MTPVLIILGLGILGVGIVVWATRPKKDDRPFDKGGETDTGWNDPIAPADATDPFASAPPPSESSEPRP